MLLRRAHWHKRIRPEAIDTARKAAIRWQTLRSANGAGCTAVAACVQIPKYAELTCVIAISTAQQAVFDALGASGHLAVDDGAADRTRYTSTAAS